ncbi:hypothetical protein [Nocardia sp. NPDC047038]|uniref:hypothetical protein n=1 Tax=Nocardia sp. NPDC047038 TaxID=3154338 RepID=UPI0033EAD417
MDTMQVCWSDTDRTHAHATYAGHRTVCDLPVIEARPIHASVFGDLTCPACTRHARLQLARAAAQRHLSDHAAELDDPEGLVETAMQIIVPEALARRRAGDSWHAITTDYLLATDPPSQSDPDTRFAAGLGSAVLKSLEATEQ